MKTFDQIEDYLQASQVQATLDRDNFLALIELDGPTGKSGAE